LKKKIDIFVMNADNSKLSHIINPAVKKYNKVASELSKRKLKTFFDSKDIYSWARHSKHLKKIKTETEKQNLEKLHNNIKKEKMKRIPDFLTCWITKDN